MTQKLEHERLSWTRFSDYVIEDGWIKPAPGAMPTEYHPWDEYRASMRRTWQPRRRGRHRGDAQYMTFIRLGETLQGCFQRLEQTAIERFQQGGPTITEADENAVLAWVRANGVLGIELSTSKIGTPGQLQIHELFALLSQSPARRRPESWIRVPAHTPEFFASDRGFENIQHFIEATYVFAKAAKHALEGVYDLIDDLRGGNFTLTKAIRDAKGNLAGAEDEVIYPSLIHAFAEMMVRDAKGGFRIFTCPGCGGLVRTNYPRTMFCSEPCRWKMLRRDQRRKEAAARTTPAKRGRPRKAAGKKEA